MTYKNPIGSQSIAKTLGLPPEEFQTIVRKLVRVPNFTELCMFSAMWSEHCSYKNSILLLKTLYSKSDLLLVKPGEENAGVIRLNDRYALVFKVESHNHPSAIEPYQGAATGVGGIMRDIFTMGARPIASLNALRFGLPDDTGNQHLLRQVVKGIGDYGNSLGIPCIGGELFFDRSYTKNPLVNAMCIGVVETANMVSSKASRPGSLVIYAGAKTGRDGIHGASFASKNLSEDSLAERSAVQVGDPFLEKLLMEASLECMKKGLLVSTQDMGAAGLLSASCEMANAGGVGLRMDTSLVPTREKNMQPFELLLSESQERMLFIAEKENFPEIERIFQKWGLYVKTIGKIISEKKLQIFYKNELYADIPPALLSGEAPRYKRKSLPPKKIKKNFSGRNWNMTGFFQKVIEEKDPESFKKGMLKIMSSYNLASKRQIYEQYDTEIGLSRLLGPGQNAGLIRLYGEKIGIAASMDCRSDYVALDPYLGAKHCVAEAYRNIISTGASPVGITNCLNFADPYKPENFYFFEQALRGMSDAAEFFGIPITGGNVSFYNESQEGQVLPSPVIGMVGLHEDPTNAPNLLLRADQKIYLLGSFQPNLNSSVYSTIFLGESLPPLPTLSLETEKEVSAIFMKLFRDRKIINAIDLSLGGLLAALLRMLFITFDSGLIQTGFRFQENALSRLLSRSRNRSYDEILWGETAHSYLISTDKNSSLNLEKTKSKDIDILLLGETTKKMSISFNSDLEVDLKIIYQGWKETLSI